MKVLKGLMATALLLSFGPVAPDATGLQAPATRTSTLTTASCAAAATGGLCQRVNANQPGGNNPDVISATMTLVDDGATLVGSGTGTGFRPGRTYVSLLYLNPNVATCARFPQGQQALTANTANADNDFNSMFLGFWVVRNNGTALFSVYPGKTSPLGGGNLGGLANYATVSVREAAGAFRNPPQQGNNTITNIAAGRDIPPNIFPLRACGTLVTP